MALGHLTSFSRIRLAYLANCTVRRRPERPNCVVMDWLRNSDDLVWARVGNVDIHIDGLALAVFI